MKKLPVVSIDNSCLGPAELRWIESKAGPKFGTTPPMPMPMRKMGLNRRIIEEWLFLNADYLQETELQYQHIFRYARDPEKMAHKLHVFFEKHPYYKVLKILNYEGFRYDRLNSARVIRNPNQPYGGTYTDEDIKNFLAEQKGLCVYCKSDFSNVRYTVDHKLAIVRGGTNDLKNLQLLCRPCNSKKGATKDHQFKLKMAQKYQKDCKT